MWAKATRLFLLPVIFSCSCREQGESNADKQTINSNDTISSITETRNPEKKGITVCDSIYFELNLIDVNTLSNGMRLSLPKGFISLSKEEIGSELKAINDFVSQFYIDSADCLIGTDSLFSLAYRYYEEKNSVSEIYEKSRIRSAHIHGSSTILYSKYILPNVSASEQGNLYIMHDKFLHIFGII